MAGAGDRRWGEGAWREAGRVGAIGGGEVEEERGCGGGVRV